MTYIWVDEGWVPRGTNDTTAVEAPPGEVTESTPNHLRRRARRRRGLVVLSVAAVLLVLVAGFVVVRRASSAAGATIPGLVAGDDVDPRDHLALADDVVVVRDGASHIRSVSDDHTTYTIDEGAPGLDELAVGKVALLAGIDAGRVVQEDRHDGQVTLKLAPVAIADVIKEGSLRWDDARPRDGQTLVFVGAPIVVDPPEATTPGTTAGTTAGAPEPTSTPTPPPAPASPPGASPTPATPSGWTGGDPSVEPLGLAFRPDAPDARLPAGVDRASPIDGDVFRDAAPEGTTSTEPRADNPKTFSTKVRGWDATYEFSRPGAGLDLNATLTKGVGQGSFKVPGATKGFDDDTGALQISGSLKLHLDDLSHSGSIDAAGGRLTALGARVPMRGYFEFASTVLTEVASQFPKSFAIKVPIVYEWLIVVNGLPFYAYVQASWLFQPSLSAKKTGLKTPFRVDFGGTAGASFANDAGQSKDTTLTAHINKRALSLLQATPSVGAMAMIVAVEAPRVGFGLGTTAFTNGARLGIYFDLIASQGYTIAPSVAMVPCRSVSTTISGGVGSEFKLKIWGSETSAGAYHPLFKDTTNSFSPNLKACAPPK